MIFKAYPDFNIVVVDVLIDGSKAATFERVAGTWIARFTVAAAGKPLPATAGAFDRPGVMRLAYNPDHSVEKASHLSGSPDS